MLVIEEFEDFLLTSEGFELALSDLYSITSKTVRSDKINTKNAIGVLIAACFLELVDLAQYCSDVVVKSMSKRKDVVGLSSDLHHLSMQLENRDMGRFGKLFENHLEILNASCLASLCYIVSRFYISAEDQVESINQSKLLTPESFIAQLPLTWIQRLISSDALCVASEYDRYQLIKHVKQERLAGFLSDNIFGFGSPELLGNEIDESVDGASLSLTISRNLSRSSSAETVDYTIQEDESKYAVAQVKDYISQFFDGMLSKKRKVSDRIISKENHVFKNDVISKRKIKPMRRKVSTAEETWANIFKDGVVYTFMSFNQLEQVKRDGIVASETVLQSYWLQAELLAHHPGAIPPFRFASSFKNIKDILKKKETMYSDIMSCAGMQFRLLLSVEEKSLKALLQKTKGNDAYQISYSIYCIDHREGNNLDHLMTPVTRCDFTGAGHAYDLSLIPTVKGEFDKVVDEICLIACVNFE